MRTSALFGAKNFGFFEIYGVFAWTRGGIEPMRTKGEKGQFSRFYANIFWTAPNYQSY